MWLFARPLVGANRVRLVAAPVLRSHRPRLHAGDELGQSLGQGPGVPAHRSQGAAIAAALASARHFLGLALEGPATLRLAGKVDPCLIARLAVAASSVSGRAAQGGAS